MKYSLTDVGNMTDGEIARSIARECVVAVYLSLLGKKQKAQLFIVHVLCVVAVNKDAVERWMKARQVPKARFVGKTLSGEQFTVVRKGYFYCKTCQRVVRMMHSCPGHRQIGYVR